MQCLCALLVPLIFKKTARYKTYAKRHECRVNKPSYYIVNESLACWMHTFGRNARPDEGESALFGNLSLVGVGGKFRITITQRQLVLSNSLKKGIRLNLASISRTRSIDIPKVPGGIVLWGGAACYLGATALIPPLGYAVSILGASSAISYFLFKNPALVIETNIGDRHIIQSKLNDQETLLKIQMIIQKVSNGQSVVEAKAALEREFRSTRPTIKPKGLLSAPNTEELTIDIDSQIQPIQNYNQPRVGVNRVQPEFNIPFFDAQEPIMETNFGVHEDLNKNRQEIPEKTSAYQQTWGRNEPSWYNEKKTENRTEFGTGTMNSDMFGFEMGGMFDAEPAPSSLTETVNYSPPPLQQSSYSAPEQYIGQKNRNDDSEISIFGSYSTETEIRERPMSSAGMIKAANGLKRSPMNNHQNSLLPTPTDEAVRIECKPGLVKKARAQQSLRREAQINTALPEPADLEEFPGLLKIANSLGDGRLVLRKPPVRKRRLSIIERILVPRARNYIRDNESYASEYGDPDGFEVNEKSRFQTQQHLRLRSDQEHQADRASNRILNMNNAKPSLSGRDAMSQVVNRVSRGEEHSPTILIDEEQPMLRFNQMRRTSNKDDSGHVRGIRRLE